MTMVENRKDTRVPFRCKLSISALHGGARVSAFSRDISLKGVGVIAGGSFQRGQQVLVSFHLRGAADKNISETVRGQIAWMRTIADTNEIGIQFQEPLTEANTPVLLAKIQRI
jgi:hypothetical protein